MNTLNFNDADLKANREGRLSDTQQKRFDADLEKMKRRSIYLYCAGAVLLAIVGGGGLFNTYQSLDRDLGKMFSTPHSTLLISTLLACVGGLGFALLFDRYTIWRYSRGRIYKARGQAHFRQTLSLKGHLPMCTLTLRYGLLGVSGVYFLDPEPLKHFEHEKYYHIYYLHNGRPQILSAEEIEPEKTKR